MPAPQDPSLWQMLLDSKFVQVLATAFAIALAMGAALKGFLSRYMPQSKEDRNLKAEIENGLPAHLIKEVAHELHGLREDVSKLRETVGDLRERVSAIEGFLRSSKGVQ